MQETQVQSMGWEDPLEKEMAFHSSILAWKISWQRSLVDYSPWGHKVLDMIEEWAHTGIKIIFKSVETDEIIKRERIKREVGAGLSPEVSQHAQIV